MPCQYGPEVFDVRRGYYPRLVVFRPLFDGFPDVAVFHHVRGGCDQEALYLKTEIMLKRPYLLKCLLLPRVVLLIQRFAFHEIKHVILCEHYVQFVSCPL